MRRAAWPLALVLLLAAGCADHTAEHLAAVRAYVGRSEAELVRAFGVPSRTFETDGHRFLAYRASQTTIVPGGPAFPPFGPYGSGFGGGFPPEVIEQVCETTFEVAGGQVVSASLRGNACG